MVFLVEDFVVDKFKLVDWDLDVEKFVLIVEDLDVDLVLV